MITVKNVSGTRENLKFIRSIRDEVFINEQGIAPELECDGLDEEAVHALVFVEGNAVATGRILVDGHIGRIAVLAEYRGRGFGAMVVSSLIDEALAHHYSRVYLGSQKQAIDFYIKLGFRPFGDEFMDAGIPHLSMERLL